MNITNLVRAPSTEWAIRLLCTLFSIAIGLAAAFGATYAAIIAVNAAIADKNIVEGSLFVLGYIGMASGVVSITKWVSNGLQTLVSSLYSQIN